MSAGKTRIMYVQRGWSPGRIVRVRMSKTGRTVYYGAIALEPIRGYKANFIDRETCEQYWVSGPRKDGQDSLYPGVVEIDDDVREEYWRSIRASHDDVTRAAFRSLGVHGRHATRC